MTTESLEEFLARSKMEYAEKATWLLRGVENVRAVCPDCPFPPLFTEDKTQACCKKCTFHLMVWLFNTEQEKIWQELRPADMKKKEIQKAINEHKIPQIEEIIGRVPELTPLPLFLTKII